MTRKALCSNAYGSSGYGRTRPLGFLTLALLVLAAPLRAQPAEREVPARHPEAGRPFIETFRSADYDAGQATYAVVEDARGVVYAGNSNGVLAYDGADWRLVPLPNRLLAQSLAVVRAGPGGAERVWVGGHGELGYLAPYALGRTAFVSLLGELPDDLPQDARNFGQVWETYATDDGIYFTTERAVFRWAPSAGSGRDPSASSGQAPGAPAEAAFTPFETEVDAILERGGLHWPGAMLPGGRFALNTLSEGVVVIDRAPGGSSSRSTRRPEPRLAGRL